MQSPPRTPPRFVPTLTEVISPMALAASPAPAPPAPDAAQEQLIHRVLQRVDLSLERQLNEAIAKLLLEHTRSLGPRLREEIEFAVRQAVTDAFAEELAQRGAQG